MERLSSRILMKIESVLLLYILSFFCIIFVGFIILFGTLQAFSSILASDINGNIPIAGGTIVATLIGIVFFRFLINRNPNKAWDLLIVICPLLIGIGGLIAFFNDIGLIFIGLASSGLVLFIIPTNISSLFYRYFGTKFNN